MKMASSLFSFLLLSFLGLTGAGQETIEILSLYDKRTSAMSHSGDHPLAVPLNEQQINAVSTSVLKAETWLRTHVLAHFPAKRITTIVVTHTSLCQNEQDAAIHSVNNIHYTLTRWGLDKEIKVSVAFSHDCFNPHLENVTKQLLEFLNGINSTYSLIIVKPEGVDVLSSDIVRTVSSHADLLKKVGTFANGKVNVIVTTPEKLNKRKLITSAKSYAITPNPVLETSSQPHPLHSLIGFSVPSNAAKTPLPPPARSVVTPSPLTFPVAPEHAPFVTPAPAPYGYDLPPCNPGPADGTAMPPAPQMGMVQKLWCVAKPSVPEETLQEAIDYACGEGGADCEEITLQGNCFYPDTVVAHASYAFNSYWQMTKRNGGTCNFGGTAMIINSDPSFLHCRFPLI